jgi:hypothetical protein
MKPLVSESKKNLLNIAQIQANQLQRNYKTLKSPSTQNVRNPFPMWALVQSVLPSVPKFSRMVKVNVTRTAIIDGKKYSRTVTEEMPAIKFLGTEIYDASGMTMDEVTESIRAQGFIAKQSTVAVAISKLNAQGLIEKVCFTRKTPNRNRRGVVSCRKYFLQQS